MPPDFRRGAGRAFRGAGGTRGSVGVSRHFDDVAPLAHTVRLRRGKRCRFPLHTRLGVSLFGLPPLNHQQMVRLVFRPYTQVRKAICTSAHLRASTRVSSGFALLRHSSTIFRVTNKHTRTQTFHRRSWSVDGAGTGHPTSQVTCASWVFHPPARMHVILLGPCFKTGSLEAFRQHLEDAVPEGLKERP